MNITSPVAVPGEVAEMDDCETTRAKVAEKIIYFFRSSFFKIRKYFSPTTSLPSHKETRIRVVSICEANESMKRVLEKQAKQEMAKKHKQHTYFTDVDSAKFAKEAATIAKIRSQNTKHLKDGC